MSSASNSRVNPDPGRAHETLTWCTPCSWQRTRGKRACMWASCWKKSRWRHCLSSASCTGHAFCPQPSTGQEKRAPRGKSRYRSRRPPSGLKSVRVTFHGSSSPNAILNRSVLPDVMSPLFVRPLSVMTVWATRADQVDLRGPNPHDLARSHLGPDAPLSGLSHRETGPSCRTRHRERRRGGLSPVSYTHL